MWLLVAVLAMSGCAESKPRVLVFNGEHMTIRTEIRDVAAEIIAVEKRYEAGERVVIEALALQADQRLRTETESRLASVRRSRLEILKVLQSFEGRRRDGDRILWVGTFGKAQTSYVLVRDGAVVAQGGFEHWIE